MKKDKAKNIEKKVPEPTKPLGDKILGAHNNPATERDYTENFNVDTTSSWLDESQNEEEYLHRKKLEEVIFQAFQTSRWYPLSTKKIPKDLIPHLFQEILEKLENNEFGFVEKFVGICDYLDLGYSKAYETVPIKYREMIVNEMEEKFQVLSKRKIGRLF